MSESKPIRVQEIALRCQHCGSEAFRNLEPTRISLQGASESAVSAAAYACGRCGMLIWFVTPPPDRNGA